MVAVGDSKANQICLLVVCCLNTRPHNATEMARGAIELRGQGVSCLCKIAWCLTQRRCSSTKARKRFSQLGAMVDVPVPLASKAFDAPRPEIAASPALQTLHEDRLPSNSDLAGPIPSITNRAPTHATYQPSTYHRQHQPSTSIGDTNLAPRHAHRPIHPTPTYCHVWVWGSRVGCS